VKDDGALRGSRKRPLTRVSIRMSDEYTSINAKKMGMPPVHNSVDNWRSVHHSSRLDTTA
jgi:hypothetical protein